MEHGQHHDPARQPAGVRDRLTLLAVILSCVALLGAAVVMRPGSAGLAPRSADDLLLSKQVAALLGDGEGYHSVAVAVIQNGLVFTATFTARDMRQSEPTVTAQTPFQLGWLSTALTGLLVADLAQRGTVRLDEKLGDLIPELRQADPAVRSITVEELATDRSGLPALLVPMRGTPGEDGSQSATSPTVTAAGRTRLVRPRGQYAGSAMGYALLSAALAHRTGEGYAQLLREHVVTPAGMSATTVPRTRNEIPHDAATQYWGRYARKPIIAADGAASASIYSTTCDLARLLGTLLSSSTPGLDAVQPRYPAHGNQRTGFGWLTGAYEGRTLSYQASTGDGVQSFVGFDRAAQRGVVMLGNSQKAISGVALRLLLTRPAGPRGLSNAAC